MHDSSIIDIILSLHCGSSDSPEKSAIKITRNDIMLRALKQFIDPCNTFIDKTLNIVRFTAAEQLYLWQHGMLSQKRMLSFPSSHD